MARFYFHLHNDIEVPDYEGTELPSLAAAREMAIREARILIGEMVRESGRVVPEHRIDIEDGQGQVLGSVRFGDVLRIED